MNCKDFNKNLFDYIDGTAPEKVQTRMETHAAECATCRAALEEEIARAKELKNVMTQATQDIEVDPFMATRVTAMLEADNHSTRTETTMKIWKILQWSAVGAFCALIMTITYNPSLFHIRDKQETDTIAVADKKQIEDETTLVSATRDAEVKSMLNITTAPAPEPSAEVAADAKPVSVVPATRAASAPAKRKEAVGAARVATAPVKLDRTRADANAKIYYGRTSNKKKEWAQADASRLAGGKGAKVDQLVGPVVAPKMGGITMSEDVSSPEKQRKNRFLSEEYLCRPVEPPASRPVDNEFNTEDYSRIYENEFKQVENEPLSTFSIDVDTASYAQMRRFISNDTLPPPDAIRTEELINYFTYSYPQPTGKHPVSITLEAAQCPWNATNTLVLIGMQGKNLVMSNAPANNLVFLLDVSGSMSSPDKLPLLKKAFTLLTEQLRMKDRISIVVYAGSSGCVLNGVRGDKKKEILEAINKLNSGGSTAGGQGIELAYKIAKDNFIPDGNNRVILATDGDFNVGVSSDAGLVRLIEEKRKEGVFLSVLGFGTGNFKDNKMEQLANKGNGNYSYIDSIMEAKKVLVKEFSGTVFTIAKDVKLQIEFNPKQVYAYRLIGYENRMLAKEDFNDDTKDAGEIGAGHCVTALYELMPHGATQKVAGVDELKYQTTKTVDSDELLTVKVRYKQPDKDISVKFEKPVNRADVMKEAIAENIGFASAVAEFSMLLRDSKYKGTATCGSVMERAKKTKGVDDNGYRAEFIRLVERAELLQPKTTK